MPLDEKSIEELEASFPSLSGSAFSAAFHEALDAGLSVLVANDGAIYRVYPDGRRVQVATTNKPTRVAIGSHVNLR